MLKNIDCGLESWCRNRGVTISNEKYERPEAKGYVNAWMFSPKNYKNTFVLFAHATGNDGLFPQSSLFQALLTEGYRVFTFDLDGHGSHSSTKLDPEIIKSCVARAAQEAIKACALNDFHLIGQSLGGALSLAAVGSHQLNAKSLVLISMPIQLQKSSLSIAWEFLGLCSFSIFKEVSNYGVWGLIPAFGSFKRKAYPIRLMNSENSPSPLQYVNAVTKIINHLQLKSISMNVKLPTLLCYGTFDHIAPISQATILNSTLENSKICVAPRETHFTTLFSKTVEKSILNWLNCH